MKEISTGHNPSGAFGLLLFLLFLFVLFIKYLKCSPYFYLIFGVICYVYTVFPACLALPYFLHLTL